MVSSCRELYPQVRCPRTGLKTLPHIPPMVRQIRRSELSFQSHLASASLPTLHPFAEKKWSLLLLVSKSKIHVRLKLDLEDASFGSYFAQPLPANLHHVL